MSIGWEGMLAQENNNSTMTASNKKNAPSKIDDTPTGYSQWLGELKDRIGSAQKRTVQAVNHELVLLYWQIGNDILTRQNEQGWGAKIVDRLSFDLRLAFPDMKGFSRANLMYMRAFAEAWSEEQIVQQLVGQLPWGHNLELLTKLKEPDDRIAYAKLAIEHGWSRNALVNHIELQTAKRIGNSQTNFSLTLPKPMSDLAHEAMKDPYKLDFLGLGAESQEREIEKAIATHLTDFLLELGSGFAFVGKQVHLEIGGDDFYIDLLFYHTKLHCYVVIELKTGDFKPEHLGQLSFYISAVDNKLRTSEDAPTIGLLLCKSKNKLVVEYALQDIHKPMGVSEYQLTKAIPDEIKAKLPTIEQIEAELGR